MTSSSRPAIVRTFMTHEMSDSDIVAVSTGREAEFKRIMGAISRSRAASPGTLQHVVLYGSRGFGKSFMMRRVEIALGQHNHGDGPVRFLLLPEEQHNLQKSPHALLTYITVLLKQQDSDAAFEEAKFQWPKPGEAARRWTEAAEKLEEALDHSLPNGQGLVVVAVENFDTLLATLFAEEEDEQRLREWLFRSGNRLMLLATATGTVDMDYDRPLFQAFETVRLTPWTTEDCITYFNRKRESEGKPPLDASQEAKARAVAEFIGGTPRLAQLLGEVIETEDALSVSATMDALADRLAEYYRRRIEDLGPLVRGLLDALIRGGEPASQTELAQRVGADGQNQIARAMADLQRADIVRGRSALDSRETLYTVTDRVFAHYYRLRQGSRTARATPLASILDFLRSFYTRNEQRTHGLRYLMDGRVAEGALLSRLAMEGLEPRKNLYTERFERRFADYLSVAPTDFGSTKTIIERLRIEPEQVLMENGRILSDAPVTAAIRTVLRAQCLCHLGHADMAAQELEDAVKAGDADLMARVVILDDLVILLSDVTIKRKEAAQFGVGLLGTDLGSLPPVIGSRANRLLGWSLNELNRHEEALKPLAQAVELARAAQDRSAEAASLGHTGYSLGALGRHAEALDALSQAVELARQVGDRSEEAASLRCSGYSLGALGRHAEALDALSQAVELARQVGNRSEEAESLRLSCYSLGALGRHAEALDALSQSVELARQVGNRSEEAGSLRYSGYALGALGRHAEALDVLSQAVELAREVGDQALLSVALYYVFRSARHLPLQGVSSLVAEFFQIGQSYRDVDRLRILLVDCLLSSLQARELDAFDAVIVQLGDWLTECGYFFVLREHGEILADIAAKDGRAAGWEAMASVLPRLAHLQALAPETNRHRTWLSNLVSGFAGACRDPGLLRDVAGLLTPDLSPEAEASAALLRDLARVDDADVPERVLSRMDPDRALVIRRLRGLPDPEPPRRQGAGRKTRR